MARYSTGGAMSPSTAYRRLKTSVRAVAAAIALIVLLAVAASAAELVTAELSGTVNTVTVEQGQTVSFQISLWATGTIRCTATPTNPATAKVDTVYHVDVAGAVTSDTLSSAVPFYADPFCNVTWPGDPTRQSVDASVTTDINTPLGDYAIRLHTVTTTPPGTGSTLADATPTLVTFHVVPSTDRTPPTISCAAPSGTLGSNGWYVTEVAVTCTASDSGSGLADPSQASFTLETTGDGLVSTPSMVVKDNAGNEATAGPFGPFSIDTVAPSVSCGPGTGTPGSFGWYTSKVSVACAASDPTSGLADPADATFSLDTVGDGVGSTASRIVADAAGNAVGVGPFGPFSVDTVGPSVGCGAPTGTLGDNGWYTSDVSVACTASDATSGLADPSDAVFTMSTAGEGSRSIDARTVSDVAGNPSTTDAFGPFDVDLVDPSVTLAVPADGATFVLDSQANASFSCGDTADGSGVAACAGTVADGSPLDTGSVGTHSFTVTATDLAGRSTVVTHTYSVVYAFEQPATPGGKTTARASSSIPVWFSLDGITDVSVVTALTSAPAACDGSGATGPATSVSMNGALRYDRPSDRFNFVWKTDKSWAGTCRLLEIGLNDGTTHTLLFNFS
ncbi:MAG: PxKF domain-containing protein [Actinomycetota bacterium]